MKRNITVFILISFILITGMNSNIFENSNTITDFPVLHDFIQPNVDTVFPITPFPEGAGYFDGSSFVWKSGLDNNTHPLELNWLSTDSAVIEFLYRPTRLDQHFIMSKNLTGTYGWWIVYDAFGWGQKDLTLNFVGLGYKTICYITDTTIFHKIKIVFTKSDSSLRMYHGNGINPDTNTFNYSGCVWNSDYHGGISRAFCFGGWHLTNPDCSGVQTSAFPAKMFRGYLKYLRFSVNDTNYNWDFRPSFDHRIYDAADYYFTDRPYVINSYHLHNGNTFTYSKNDVKWVGDRTRLYPCLWDTVLFQPGIQQNYIFDSNLCESYGISLDTVTYKGSRTVVWGGRGNRANNIGWDSRLYDKISPQISYWNYDSSKWKSLGNGFGGFSITIDITSHNRTLYACGDWTRTLAGDFTTLADTTKGIAQFDLDTGTVWRRLGGTGNTNGLNSQGLCLHVWNNALYAGGSFNNAGGIGVNYITKWNGTSFSALGSTGVNSAVWSIVNYNNKLIAAGDFTDRGTRIAQWDGSAWSNPFGAGANGTIYKLKVCPHNNTLWAAGRFTSIGGIATNGIGYWDGNSWHGIGSGVEACNGFAVTSLETYGHIMFFGGYFFRINGKFVKKVAAYNVITGELYNIGTLDLRTEELRILTNAHAPYNNKPWLVYSGDGYTVESDGFKFGNVVALDLNKTGLFIGINSGSGNIPVNFALYQNYPNPFNPVTNIRFDIPKASKVKLVVYDILGREVRVLVNEFKNAGTYEQKFDGTNLASGVYFYRLSAGDASAPLSINFTEIKKMVLVK